MKRPPRPRAVSLSEIAGAAGGQLVGGAGKKTKITGVSSLDEARPGDLAYIESDRFVPAAVESRASAFVVGRPISELRRPQIVVADPRYAFVRVLERLFLAPAAPRGIADEVVRGAGVEIGPDVSIWPFVTLGDRAKIGARVVLYPGVFIGEDVVIGDDCILYPRVTVREGCAIGCRVIIHSGAVIGSDGFGYLQHDGRHHKIPQLGSVVIEDDVELGANVTVDRATFGRTLIGRGTKVDNLVQIAHNVTVGPDTILVAQVGIAGSTRLGAHVVVGGQAGLGDHLEIGDRAMIAARSGVGSRVAEGEIVSGSPALPHDTSIKIHRVFLRLPELRQQLRELAERVSALESRAVPAPRAGRTWSRSTRRASAPRPSRRSRGTAAST
jgi:UDP-3-O-[3-hydroxymyristoyl] glucosamine N-acyltransferase